MALLATQVIDEDGLEAAYSDANGGGDTFNNANGDVIAHIKNPGASEATMTFTAQDTSEEVAGFGTMTKADLVVTIPAGEERFVGPFPKRAYNDANNLVTVTPGGAGAADVDIAILKVSGLQKV